MMGSSLKVRMVPTNDGKSLTPLVCFENGEPLPGQIAVNINTAVDDRATVTVTLGEIEFAV